jgi:hypothetical protein
MTCYSIQNDAMPPIAYGAAHGAQRGGSTGSRRSSAIVASRSRPRVSRANDGPVGSRASSYIAAAVLYAALIAVGCILLYAGARFGLVSETRGPMVPPPYGRNSPPEPHARA